MPQTGRPADRQIESLMGNLVDREREGGHEEAKRGEGRSAKGELETYAVV